MSGEKTPRGGFSSLDTAKTTGIHYRITALSAAGVFLDGYDISIIGVALVIISTLSGFSYVNTPLGKGLMAASTTIGMLFGVNSFCVYIYQYSSQLKIIKEDEKKLFENKMGKCKILVKRLPGVVSPPWIRQKQRAYITG